MRCCARRCSRRSFRSTLTQEQGRTGGGEIIDLTELLQRSLKGKPIKAAEARAPASKTAAKKLPVKSAAQGRKAA